MASNGTNVMIEQAEIAYRAVLAKAVIRQCELAERDSRAVRRARAQRFDQMHKTNVERWTR